jgi:hypothetical protein
MDSLSLYICIYLINIFIVIIYINIHYMEIKKEIYKRCNRPAAQKLLQLDKSEELQGTSKEVKEFQAGRVEVQHLKET